MSDRPETTRPVPPMRTEWSPMTPAEFWDCPVLILAVGSLMLAMGWWLS